MQVIMPQAAPVLINRASVRICRHEPFTEPLMLPLHFYVQWSRTNRHTGHIELEVASKYREFAAYNLSLADKPPVGTPWLDLGYEIGVDQGNQRILVWERADEVEHSVPTMQIRMHRGGLADSLETMKEIPATRASVLAYLAEVVPELAHAKDSDLEIALYSNDKDDRPGVGWQQTYTVVVDSNHLMSLRGVWAFCSAMPFALDPSETQKV